MIDVAFWCCLSGVTSVTRLIWDMAYCGLSFKKLGVSNCDCRRCDREPFVVFSCVSVFVALERKCSI